VIQDVQIDELLHVLHAYIVEEHAKKFLKFYVLDTKALI
jgi:hypothetical protein